MKIPPASSGGDLKSGRRPAPSVASKLISTSPGPLTLARMSVSKPLPSRLQELSLAFWPSRLARDVGPNVELYCQWQASERGIAPAEVKAEIEAGMALREMPTDTDMAEAAVFLAPERSRFAFA